MKSDDANELPANKPWIYLVPALLFAALLAVWWLLDHNYPLWDAGSHFQDAINYAKLIRHPHLLRADYWQQFLTVSFNYPLTQHLIFGFAKYLFGYGRLSDAIVNIAYLLVLSASLASIVKMARGSNLAAALAVFIVNCYPWVALFSHTQMLDFGHITLSALAFYAMIKWSQDRSWPNALFMALAVAMGATAKQAAMVFLVVPCLILLVDAIKAKSKKQIAHMLLTGLATLTALLLWVIPNKETLTAWKNYYYPQATQSSSYLEVLNHHLWNYVSSLPALMSPLLFALWLYALIAVKPQFGTKPRGLLFAGMITGIPLMCLLSMNNAEARYVLPALLSPALDSALALSVLFAGSTIKKVAAYTICTLAFLQFVVLNFCPYPINIGTNTLATIKRLAAVAGEIAGPPMAPMPPGDPWGQDWIFSTIGDGKTGYLPTVNLFPSTRELSVHTLTIAALSANSPATVSTFRRFTLNGDVFEYTAKDMDYYSWFVFKTGYQGKNFVDQVSAKKYDAAQSQIVNDTQNFILVGTRKLEDGSIMSI
ncbi:MAG: hypothetical protein IPO31_23125 [Candidatus Obscuribacter sp.]|nr:hypothetical protein [Candidatus Obscuribacter sp.]